MIEINLLPGAAKKKRSRGAGGFDIKALAGEWATKVKDPILLGSAAAAILGFAAIGFMFVYQGRRERDLNTRLEKAVTDSTRFAAVLAEQIRTTAKRDSVARTLRIIRSIDNNRFVWSHILDEISNALPPYTWLTRVEQTSNIVNAAARPPAAKPGAPGAAAAPAAPVAAASAEPDEPSTEFRLIGNTVDIQALTRFYKNLESSPFLQNVRLVRSELVVIDGKDVTEFELAGAYETPPPSVIRTVPLSASVR
jgi:Tfp pilus assembly protein PilN